MMIHRALICAVLVAWVVPACKKSETVEIGGACNSRDDCKDRRDCMQLAPGKSVCTEMCVPSRNSCPAPTTCKEVNTLMDTHGGETVTAKGIPYCLP